MPFDSSQSGKSGGTGEGIERKRKVSMRRKRVRHLMPELRQRIPVLFDLSKGNAEKVAAELGVPSTDVLAEVLYVTRKGPGKAPEARPGIANVLPFRRTA